MGTIQPRCAPSSTCAEPAAALGPSEAAASLDAMSTRTRRNSPAYRCTECGWSTAKWVGRCEACGEWNSVAEEPVAARLHVLVDRTVKQVENTLGETAWNGSFGKRAAIIFGEQDDFFQYISHFSIEGEHPSGGGVSVSRGFTHIALPRTTGETVNQTIIHELTHDALAYLTLPLWLNEGGLVRALAAASATLVSVGLHAVAVGITPLPATCSVYVPGIASANR